MVSQLLNLRQFLQRLRNENEIVDIYEEVDPCLEIAEIHRRVAAADGPALFFHNVKGSTFPVTTNLFGSKQRVDLAFQNRPDKVLTALVDLLTHNFPPKLTQIWEKRDILKNIFFLGTKFFKNGPVTERKISPPDLEKLPLLKSWPLDGGHFITLPLVYTEPPGGGPPNLGMYRIQRFSKNRAGLHFQIQKGGGFHLNLAEAKHEALPVNIFIGGAPALILSSITPLPENIPELLIAGLLQGKKISVCRRQESIYPLIAECEFALIGHSPAHVRHPEGPFGDHYGYYSWTHDFPLFECHTIYHRKNAIYPATIVGKPRQEDFYIGDYLQEILSPLFPIVMPGVKALWSFGETGFHSLSAAIVRERYHRECMMTAFRILGEGQLSLTKFLLLTDQPVNIRNFNDVLTIILERFQPETDLFIFSNLSLDTLDYTGPALNKGSRGILLGIGEKIRDLPTNFQGKIPTIIKQVAPYCPGCLVLECPSIETSDLAILSALPDFVHWPLLIVVDDLSKTLKNTTSFLWTVFTRFEPAADVYAHSKRIVRNHICYSGPILIDARMKSTYPPEVASDPETVKTVSNKWKKYFPEGMEMGDSNAGHVV